MRKSGSERSKVCISKSIYLLLKNIFQYLIVDTMLLLIYSTEFKLDNIVVYVPVLQFYLETKETELLLAAMNTAYQGRI